MAIDPEIYEFVSVTLDETWGQNRANRGGFRLRWSAQGWGFGVLTFVRKGGKRNKAGELEGATVECDNETMSREFVRQALAAFVEGVKLRD